MWALAFVEQSAAATDEPLRCDAALPSKSAAMSVMSRLVVPDAVVVEIGAPAATALAAYRRLLGTSATITDAIEVCGRVDFPRGTLRLSGGEQDRVLFAVADRARAGRLLSRRGWQLAEHGTDSQIIPQSPFGITDAAVGTEVQPGGDILGLDHLVFTAPSRDAAVARFGGELELDFRLELEPMPGLRQLFFRSGSLVLEVVVGSPNQTASPEQGTLGLAEPRFTLWGIAWRTVDIELTHDRLTSSGAECSEVRTGKKPGTRIFTVRDPDLAQRTVVIEQTPRPDHTHLPVHKETS